MTTTYKNVNFSFLFSFSYRIRLKKLCTFLGQAVVKLGQLIDKPSQLVNQVGLPIYLV